MINEVNMINTNENEENTNNETSTLDTRQHMLNSENFEAIKQLQDDIYKETEMKPSFRKIIVTAHAFIERNSPANAI